LYKNGLIFAIELPLSPPVMKVRSRITLYQLIMLICFSSFLVSCSTRGGRKGGLTGIFESDFVDIEEFRNVLSKTALPVDTKDSLFQQKLASDIDVNVQYAYQLSGNEPLWFDKAGLKKGAEELTGRLNELWNEGLNPGTYQVGYVQHILTALKKEKANFPVDSIVQWDRLLTRSYLGAARDLLMGVKPMKESDSLWFAKNDSTFNGATLLVTSLKSDKGIPSFDTFRPEIPDYRQMAKAVEAWLALKDDTLYLNLKNSIAQGQEDSSLQVLLQKELKGVAPAENDSMKGVRSWIATYQYYHQLRVTGKNDSATFKRLQVGPDEYIHNLVINMERLRALPRRTGAEHIWVNIPLMEVNYYKDREVMFHGRVVVGKKSRQTPSLWAPMANVVFNPPWGVPPTILKRDVGPGVGRSGPGYLARKGLRAFDSKGRDVTGMVNGENYRRFSYRQPPGARNALGEIKFNLPNKWDIYLHDTPHRENFSSRNRALSSGCVRVQNPKSLAESILADRNYTRGRIDSLIQTRRTKYEQLKRDIPVYIVYLTVASDSTGSRLRYLDDVYSKDVKMKKVYGYE
jgi:murein L,D-transpeptidase YcbB/YkuD